MLTVIKIFFKFLAGLLLRFYNEIVAGVWAILVCLPIDSYLYQIFDNKPSYNLGKNYWIFFIIYTIFFIFSAILVPYLKEWNVIHEIELMHKRGEVTFSQKHKIKSVLNDVLMYKNIFTKEGLLQFVMANLFNISVICAYFAIEEFISQRLEGVFSIVPIIFIMLFFFILTIESFLDDYLVHKIKNENRINHNNIKYNNISNKNLLTLILRNLGGGGSLSFKLSQLLVEDAIDDIYEILYISNSMDDIRKNSKSKNNLIRKQRFSRYKRMISFNAIKKKKIKKRF